jgi:hypothetical protein
MLAKRDQAYLDAHWPGTTVSVEGNQVLVLIQNYEFPSGFSPRVVELLLVLPFGFPETQPDMFWVLPQVTLSGGVPANADQVGQYLGRSWQRFSRHLLPGAWRAGVDDLQSWMNAIGRMLEREANVRVVAA